MLENKSHFGAGVAEVSERHIEPDERTRRLVVADVPLTSEDVDECQLEEMSQVGEAVRVFMVLSRHEETRR